MQVHAAATTIQQTNQKNKETKQQTNKQTNKQKTTTKTIKNLRQERAQQGPDGLRVQRAHRQVPGERVQPVAKSMSELEECVCVFIKNREKFKKRKKGRKKQKKRKDIKTTNIAHTKYKVSTNPNKNTIHAGTNTTTHADDTNIQTRTQNSHC